MPTIKGKDGKSHFAMNPQVGKSTYGGDAADPASAPPAGGDPAAAAAPPDGDADDAGVDQHVEVHHGGNPAGTPPPTDATQFHTIACDSMGNQNDIRNHDDYAGADQHVQEVMGTGNDLGAAEMPAMPGLGATPAPGLGGNGLPPGLG